MHPSLLKRIRLKFSRPQTIELPPELAISIRAVSEQDDLPAAELVAELLKTGLEHWLLKEAALERWHSLTRREREVALLILQELSYIQIAMRLKISGETARTHIRRILDKFGLHSMDDLRHAILRTGIIPCKKTTRSAEEEQQDYRIKI